MFLICVRTWQVQFKIVVRINISCWTNFVPQELKWVRNAHHDVAVPLPFAFCCHDQLGTCDVSCQTDKLRHIIWHTRHTVAQIVSHLSDWGEWITTDKSSPSTMKRSGRRSCQSRAGKKRLKLYHRLRNMARYCCNQSLVALAVTSFLKKSRLNLTFSTTRSVASLS